MARGMGLWAYTLALGALPMVGRGSALPSGFADCVEETRLHLMRTVNVVTTNPPSDRNIILSDIVAQRQ